MGMGPLHLREGDSVCILYGGCTPYVLRDIGDGYHRFIGETYVHGILRGEMMKDVEEGKTINQRIRIEVNSAAVSGG